MAASVQVHLADYLNTNYKPDCDYVDGELWERNVGKFEHARIQALLTIWFGSLERTTDLMVLTEQRIQVSPTRVRIPDVALVPLGAHPDVLLEPPVLVVEVLSPDDTFGATQRRLEDFIRMGVKHLWIVDPTTRTGRMYRDGAWIESAHLTASTGSIALDLKPLFDSIERAS